MPTTFIALLRAINVSGVNTLPTKDFVALLEGLGFRKIKTYIQTGNAVFEANDKDCSKLAGKIKAAINRDFGFTPEALLFTSDEFEKAIKANPYPEAESDPKSLHLIFLAAAPKSPDLAVIEKLLKDSERFTLKGRVFYFHAPEGVGRSKAFSKIEKALGLPGTARNFRTVRTLADMAREG
ncbi:MAG: DUF1697 domain-containing protein [Nitrospinae bacterium]|nr:DUF1697 domain-containing protein [Nitrospinota bacterium]